MPSSLRGGSRNEFSASLHTLLDRLEAVPENLTTVINTLVNSIADLINNNIEEKVPIVFELLYGQIWLGKSKKEIILSIIDEIIKKCFSHLDNLYSKYFYFGYNNLWFGNINILDFIKLYGTHGLSFRHSFKNFAGLQIPIIDILANYVTSGFGLLRGELTSRTTSLLNDLGMFLPSHAVPWFSKIILTPHRFETKRFLPITNEMDNKMLFGIFVVMATLIESYESYINKDQEDLVKQNLSKEEGMPLQNIIRSVEELLLYIRTQENQELYTIFTSRIWFLDEREINEKFLKYGFTDEQQTFIKSWIDHKINLIDVMEYQ